MSSPPPFGSSIAPGRHDLACSLFRSLDADEDGLLLAADLSEFISDPARLTETLQVLDPDSTGRITMQRFVECFDIIMGEDDDAESEAVPADTASSVGGGLDDTTSAIVEEEPKDLVSPVAGATTGNHHAKSVSFEVNTAHIPLSQRRSSVAVPPATTTTFMKIPPAGSKSAGSRSGTLKKLQLKKGYASLKHSLMVDEFMRSPPGPNSSHSSTATSATPQQLGSSSDAAAVAAAMSFPTTPALPPAALPTTQPAAADLPKPATGTLRKPTHQPRHSSTDYDFATAKAYSSLVERVHTILAWCEGANSSASTDSDANANAISFPEIETTVQYLARAFSEKEQGQLLQLFKVHQIHAIPVTLFQDVLKACLEKDPHSSPTAAETATASDSSAPAAVRSLHVSTALANGSPVASRFFDPEDFVRKFIQILEKKVEAHARAIGSTSTTSAAAPVTSPSAASTVSHFEQIQHLLTVSTSGMSVEELEALIASLRFQFRSSESERQALKNRYEFTTVFTKRMEAENWNLNEQLTQLQERTKQLEADLYDVTQKNSILMSQVSQMDSVHQTDSQRSMKVQEDYENICVMLELERRSHAKLRTDYDKLNASHETLRNMRVQTNRISFKESLEEMRHITGNIRYQRQLQLDASKVEVLIGEKNELQQTITKLELSLAEQQRVLNALQQERLDRLTSTRGSISGIAGEMPLEARHIDTHTPSALLTQHLNSVRSTEDSSPQEERETLGHDLEESNRVDSLEDSLQQSEKQMCALQNELSLANQQLLQRQGLIDQHVNRIKTLEGTLQSLTAESESSRKELTDKLSALTAEMQSLKSEHEKALRALETKHHQEQQHASQTSQSAIEALRVAHEQQMQQLRNAHADSLAAQRALVASLEQQLKLLQDSSNSMRNKLEQELKQLSESSQSREKNLVSELDTLRAQLQSTQKSLEDALRASRDHVCKIPSSSVEQLAAVQQSLEQAVADRKQVESQLDAAITARNEQERLVKQLQEAAALNQKRFEVELLEKENAISQLKASSAQDKQLIETLQTQLQDLRQKNEQLNSQLNTLYATVSTAENNVQNLNTLLDQWKSEAEKLKNQLDESKKEAANEKAALLERIAALEKQVQQLEEQIRNHVCPIAAPVLAVSVSTMASPTSVASPSPSPAEIPVEVTSAPAPPKLFSPQVASTTPAANIEMSELNSNGSLKGTAGASQLPLTKEHLMELHAYATYITNNLSNDPDLKHLFPLDLQPFSASSPTPSSPSANSENNRGCGVDVLSKLKDGLLLAKLINHACPGTIDERVLNKRQSSEGGGSTTTPLGWKAIVENLNVCITSAKALGLTMRIPDADENESDQSDATPPSANTSSEPTGEAPLISPTVAYSAIDVSPSQMLLMSADSSVEHVEILLDFLFQLLKVRLVHSLFGPEKRKIDRLAPMIHLPKLDADIKKGMMERTPSLQPPKKDIMAQNEAAASLTSPRSKASKLASRYATLSKSSPSSYTSDQFKRFVAHFNSSILTEFDQASQLSAMNPESLLLRWINWVLMKQAAQAKSRSDAPLHFIAHVSDLDVNSYMALLAQMDQVRLHKGIIDSLDQTFGARYQDKPSMAANLLQYMREDLRVNHFHSYTSIEDHHQRLNLFLLALLFQKLPMMEEDAASSPAAAAITAAAAPSTAQVEAQVIEASSSSTPGTAAVVKRRPSARLSFTMDPSMLVSSMSSASPAGGNLVPLFDNLTEEEREASVLKSFLNSSGIRGLDTINNLFLDIRSGLVLLRFVDYLEEGCVDWKLVEQNPNNKFKCVSNLNLFLSISREILKLSFVNIGAIDLFQENNAKFVLAVMWQLLRYQTIKKLNEVRSRLPKSSSSSSTTEVTDASILEWANNKVAERVHAVVSSSGCTHASSFQDGNTLRSSLFLLNLLDNLRPGSVDWKLVEVPPAGATPESDVAVLSALMRNASLTISLARKTGAELFALPQDIVYTNRKVMLLLVATFMAMEVDEE